MHNPKTMQKLRTRSCISNHAEVPLSSIHRQSTSAGRDNRLVVLHRKCPNQLVCVHDATNNSPQLLPLSVPFIPCSPIVCQAIPCKPRLKPVASLQEAAEMRIVGSGMRDYYTDAPITSSLSTKQRQLRRKVYFGSSNSADAGRQGKQTNSDCSLQDKGHSAAEIYIPTASSSLLAKPPSGNRKLRDRSDLDVAGIQPNAYYIDVMECDGRLVMEHVENPRPLPPRHCTSANNDSSETSVSPRSYFHSRPDSAPNRQCVTASELRPSRHLVCEQSLDVACSNSYEQSLYKSPPTNSCQQIFSGDREQTFYRALARPKQTLNHAGNSRTLDVDGDTLQRCSSGQRTTKSADKCSRRQLTFKKSISDVDERISRSHGRFDSQVFDDNVQALAGYGNSECTDTDSCSIPNKCVIYICFVDIIVA